MGTSMKNHTMYNHSRIVKAATSYTFDDYNQHMIHSAIGYLTSSEFDVVWWAVIKWVR